MKNESKLKKFFKRSVLTVLTLGALASATSCVAAYRDRTFQDDDQINFIAQSMETDMSFSLTNKQGQYGIMHHNNDEPIYVAISDEIENSRYKDFVVEKLNYVFGIVSDINPLYNYKIVSKEEFAKQKLLSKSTIEFKNIDFSSVKKFSKLDPNGLNERNFNFLDLFSVNGTVGDQKIYLDLEKYADMSEHEVKYVILHELCHAVFGFNDVYKNVKSGGYQSIVSDGKHDFSTIMETFNREEGLLNLITPDDYDRILAVFSPKMEKDTDRAEFIAKLEKKSSAYKQFYYNKLDEFLLKDLEKESANNAENVSRLIDTTSFAGEDGKEFKYDVKIDGDKYTFDIYQNGELTDSATGEVVHTKNFTFLKNVHTFNGFLPIETESSLEDVQDVAIFENNGPYVFYRVGDKDIHYFDEITQKAEHKAETEMER